MRLKATLTRIAVAFDSSNSSYDLSSSIGGPSSLRSQPRQMEFRAATVPTGVPLTPNAKEHSGSKGLDHRAHDYKTSSRPQSRVELPSTTTMKPTSFTLFL